jgi:hypothetical protein
MKVLIFLFFLSSCSQLTKKEHLARKSWNNRSIQEISQHPYFKNLPIRKTIMSDGYEKWLLQEEPRYQTKSYCNSLGGCLGIPSYDCESVFIVKDEIIVSLDQRGNCPSAQTIENKR